MQTIQTLINVAAATYGAQLNSTHEIGTFSMRRLTNGETNVRFKIVFRPDHIQKLKNFGVTIDLENCKMHGLSEKAPRFKQGRDAIKQGRYCPHYFMGNPNNDVTGMYDNWLISDAHCTLRALSVIAKFGRANYQHMLSIDNDTRLKADGWVFKKKYSSHIDIESQYANIKAIRRTCHNKPANSLLPIQKRVSKIK